MSLAQSAGVLTCLCELYREPYVKYRQNKFPKISPTNRNRDCEHSQAKPGVLRVIKKNTKHLKIGSSRSASIKSISVLKILGSRRRGNGDAFPHTIPKEWGTSSPIPHWGRMSSPNALCGKRSQKSIPYRVANVESGLTQKYAFIKNPQFLLNEYFILTKVS